MKIELLASCWPGHVLRAKKKKENDFNGYINRLKQAAHTCDRTQSCTNMDLEGLQASEIVLE